MGMGSALHKASKEAALKGNGLKKKKSIKERWELNRRHEQKILENTLASSDSANYICPCSLLTDC